LSKNNGRVITALPFYCHFSVKVFSSVEVLISGCIMQFGEIEGYGKLYDINPVFSINIGRLHPVYLF
jgi:hypothetical protein